MTATAVRDRVEGFDFLVVGSGGGSITAALVAKDAGLRPLIIEKQATVGGSTGYSGGVLWIPNNPLMAREGVFDSLERARTHFNAVVTYEGPGTIPARRETFLTAGPEMIAYTERRGMRWRRPDGYADYYDDLPGGEPRSRMVEPELFDLNALGVWKEKLSVYPGFPFRIYPHELSDVLCAKRTWAGRRTVLRILRRLIAMKLRGQDTWGAGAALQGRMLQIALREGIAIWPSTPFVDFLQDDDTVVGVVAERDGRRVEIAAPAGVLINAGGFARNDALRSRYGRRPTSTGWTSANPGDTGEVIEATMSIGAAVDCMDEAWWILTSLAPDGTYPRGAWTRDKSRPQPFMHHFDISLPHAIIVDRSARRVINESNSYMDVCQRLYERNNTPDDPAKPFGWAILESRHRRNYPWGTAPPGLTPRSWLRSGYMKKAQTVDGLAQQCGLDAGTLRETVERFNGFARAGRDEDFGRGNRAFDRYHGDPTVKPNPSLGEIVRPPFYAVALFPGDVGTAGGLVTDDHARVLREDGSVIRGLYATGNSTASVMGRSYIGAGASIGPSFVFGYVAGRHVAQAAGALRAARAAR
jgi:3-oxosteroid 1-dehydrogenase